MGIHATIIGFAWLGRASMASASNLTEAPGGAYGGSALVARIRTLSTLLEGSKSCSAHEIAVLAMNVKVHRLTLLIAPP